LPALPTTCLCGKSKNKKCSDIWFFPSSCAGQIGSRNKVRIGEGDIWAMFRKERWVEKERRHRAFFLTKKKKKKKGTAKTPRQPSQDCAHTHSCFCSAGSSTVPTKFSWHRADVSVLPCCISAKPHTLLVLQKLVHTAIAGCGTCLEIRAERTAVRLKSIKQVKW